MNQYTLALLVTVCVTTSSFGDDKSARRVSYARDVAPIFARNCLNCHGPDATKRQAGLRLDSRHSATETLPSGKVAVAPGDPSQSELLRRLHATGADRMPPPNSGKVVAGNDLRTIVAWIEQGAVWESHWAFELPSRIPVPAVSDASWPRTQVDHYVLSRMESAQLSPLPTANRAMLVRRLFFDVIGLPPTPSELSEFLDDSCPNAWEKLVDRLLTSPLYGQRWGRHWLDVARYGDSNGGDENHAYPLAWRYREYVIRAFNMDVPFDEFVKEQLAGDLMISMSRPELGDDRTEERIKGTGFLALGTKILAERDKTKMRADLVDEQIDTVGKSFLALTLGCARCHDHKFDPIPSRDYYALAGIFHSTQLGEHAVQTEQFRGAQAAHEARLALVTAELETLEKKLETASGEIVQLQAEDFDRGNVIVDSENYGRGIGIVSDPGAQMNFAEYDITIPVKGNYRLQLRYAALNARPGTILINGKLSRKKAISQVSGGWMPENQRWFSEGDHLLHAGKNILRIESSPLMSHIDQIRLIRRGELSPVSAVIEQLSKLENERDELRSHPPQPVSVMVATEGDVSDVKIHLRGSHLSLGPTVPRGFPEVVSVVQESKSSDQESFEIPETQSGRLQLAEWMTNDQSGAGFQTARVIANRIWLWHFGRGLVPSPDNFGVQGQPPSHPALLDWLAAELIDSGWSLKSLHRQILLSATYRQGVTHSENEYYCGMPRRRLEAEVIRDSLLFHAQRLDRSPLDQPIIVKFQDPSPDDLKKNEQIYGNSRRRSVYLPVVRSNVYRFLTLFDFPNASTPVGRRDTTTVPTQALLMLNDPFVMEQAEFLALSIVRNAESKSDVQRVADLYVRLFSRRPTRNELKSVVAMLREFTKTTHNQKDDSLSAWTLLCHTLLASSEFVYVD